MKRTRKPKSYPTENIEWGQSKTDDKFYTPTKKAIENLMLNQGSPQGKDVYDFEDGKDDGRNLPIWREQGVDRAEISQEMIKMNTDIEKIKTQEAEKSNYEARKAQKEQKEMLNQKEMMKQALNESKTEPKAE